MRRLKLWATDVQVGNGAAIGLQLFPSLTALELCNCQWRYIPSEHIQALHSLTVSRNLGVNSRTHCSFRLSCCSVVDFQMSIVRIQL